MAKVFWFFFSKKNPSLLPPLSQRRRKSLRAAAVRNRRRQPVPMHAVRAGEGVIGIGVYVRVDERIAFGCR